MADMEHVVGRGVDHAAGVAVEPFDRISHSPIEGLWPYM